MQIEDYLYRKASMNKIPLNGTFELSPVCNFKCKMCYVRKTAIEIQREGKRLRDWTEWLDLAKKCREEGMLYLLLTGGEPFIYPHFKELYLELHKMGFVISINSNGTMIDEDTIKWLKEYPPFRINITLYGGSAKTYEKICGQASGYDRTVQVIDRLTKERIKVVINASMIPENQDDMEAIMQFGKERDLLTRVSTYMFPPARREKEATDSRFTEEEAARIYLRRIKLQNQEAEYKKAFDAWLKEAEEESDTWGETGEAMKCRAGRSSFWINWEGEMTACGMIPFPKVVYPFEREFKDCWMDLTDTVREAQVLKGCAGCKKKQVCNPCVAMIHTETGTVDQRSAYLCKMSDCIIEMLRQEMKGQEYEEKV